MEGAADKDPTTSQDAPQNEEITEGDTGHEGAEDNKFQTAIGAWRSMAVPPLTSVLSR
jgi:hypothetical protein